MTTAFGKLSPFIFDLFKKGSSLVQNGGSCHELQLVNQIKSTLELKKNFGLRDC
jgi:hypothetical protein